jgi:hypothetical protein
MNIKKVKLIIFFLIIYLNVLYSNPLIKNNEFNKWFNRFDKQDVIVNNISEKNIKQIKSINLKTSVKYFKNSHFTSVGQFLKYYNLLDENLPDVVNIANVSSYINRGCQVATFATFILMENGEVRKNYIK